MKESRVPWAGALSIAALVIWGGCKATVAVSAERPSPSFATLTNAERSRIDAKAIAAPAGPTFIELPADLVGEVAGWMNARTPISPEDESARAAAFHAALVDQSRALPTPQWVDAALQKLVEALPNAMRPAAIRFSLTVLDGTARPERSERSPGASTVGGGFIVIDGRYLSELAADATQRNDRLAFAVSRELGHMALGHCRRGYQLLRLQEELDRDGNARLNRRRLDDVVARSVRLSDKRLEFLYSRQQEFEADLFALQLCRNAGFHLETGLDVVRLETIAEAPAPSPVEHAAANEPDGPRSTSPLLRLQRLRNELDGRVPGDAYGLFEFDRKTGGYSRMPDQCVAPQKRAIVFVHGIDSHFGIYRPMMEAIAEMPESREVRLLCFHYLNDDSLARSGKFLSNEMSRVCGNAEDVDFVCHSAGGLVFRYYAEVEHGKFHRAILQATPNAGSDMAKLRSLLETNQFVSGLRLGLPESLEMAFRDGKGQISLDLQPDSLFLRFLNSQPKQNKLRDRYYIFRGRAIENPAALALLDTMVALSRVSLQKQAARAEGSELLKEAAPMAEKLVLPKEIRDGDFAVSLQSAELPGATFTATYPLNHIALVRDAAVIKSVAEILFPATTKGTSEASGPKSSRTP